MLTIANIIASRHRPPQHSNDTAALAADSGMLCELLVQRSPALSRFRPLSLASVEITNFSTAINTGTKNASVHMTVLSKNALLKLLIGRKDQCKRLKRSLPQLRMLLASNTSAASAGGWALPLPQPHRAHHAAALLRDAASRDDGLVLLSGRLLVLPGGLVASVAPPYALFDLAGGCCRPKPASCWGGLDCSQTRADALRWVDDALSASVQVLSTPRWAPHWSIGWLRACSGDKCALKQREPTYRTAPSAIYLLTHSHSGRYYHALVESLPRLLFGLALLRSQQSIRVVHDSPHYMPTFLEAFGLGKRGLLAPIRGADERPLLTASVIVPPRHRSGSIVWKACMRTTVALLRYGMTGEAAPAGLMGSTASGSARTAARLKGGGGTGIDGGAGSGSATGSGHGVILLVRRSLGYDSGGHARAMFNHHELQAALQRRGQRLLVFEPSGVTFAEVVKQWASASLVIAPHGAGLSNLIFCRPGATVVELYREGDPHVIYSRLSAAFGLKYVGCRHGQGRANEDFGTSNFVLNLTWFFHDCLRGHGVQLSS